MMTWIRLMVGTALIWLGRLGYLGRPLFTMLLMEVAHSLDGFVTIA